MICLRTFATRLITTNYRCLIVYGRLCFGRSVCKICSHRYTKRSHSYALLGTTSVTGLSKYRVCIADAFWKFFSLHKYFTLSLSRSKLLLS